MKAAFVSLWQRRWCRFLAFGLVLCALPLLHPFFRQSLFGPTHEGIPMCIWEEQIRRRAQAGQPKSWVYRIFENLALVDRGWGTYPRGPSSVPLHLYVAEDADVEVRRFAIAELALWVKTNEAAIVPVLRRRLNDSDAEVRVLAAHGILTVEQDPDLFEHLVNLTQESDPRVRALAVSTMGHFGKRGVPVVRGGLTDSQKMVRHGAINAAADLRLEGIDLVPELLQLKADLDPKTRREAALALSKIHPKRFPLPEE